MTESAELHPNTRVFQSRHLLVSIFLRCGENELRFIEHSGLFFGGAFGMIQAVIWFYFPRWWILPLFGFVVGWATNALALMMIFRPVEERRVCGVRLLGLFLQRQEEVSIELARMVTAHVMRPDKMRASERASEPSYHPRMPVFPLIIHPSPLFFAFCEQMEHNTGWATHPSIQCVVS